MMFLFRLYVILSIAIHYVIGIIQCGIYKVQDLFKKEKEL